VNLVTESTGVREPGCKMSVNRRAAPVPPAGKNNSGVEQLSRDQLQMKYLAVDRNYETLKQLTRKGKLVVEFGPMP
jgi:hypothetical protein